MVNIKWKPGNIPNQSGKGAIVTGARAGDSNTGKEAIWSRLVLFGKTISNPSIGLSADQGFEFYQRYLPQLFRHARTDGEKMGLKVKEAVDWVDPTKWKKTPAKVKLDLRGENNVGLVVS